MKITKAKFITSAPALKDCPELNLPEFALVGRSNVGKSSFINSIVNIKGLAKTSNTPGKTKLINLFNVNDLFIFADLPGYGYAKVSGKMQNQWQKSLEQYLLKRKSIVSIIQLVDSRHPLQKNDIQMADWLKFNNLPSFVVASKIDEIPKSQIKNTLIKFENELNLDVLPFCKFNNFYNKDILIKIDELIKNKIK
ncbi:MAG: ribosome biogenesis GTP-binding protein YihA/YsxC [Candidatus Gastranaerophilales bacterium]|nr:ribosome biogenesis GTP-binding protein YihA/YsxC [Candidatus Gastranaerophilales bacterium]